MALCIPWVRPVTAQVSYTFSTIAGQSGVAGNADGTGSAALFSSPRGIAVDGAGNIYVADNGNHALRKITPAGVVTTVANIPNPFGGYLGPTGPVGVQLTNTAVLVSDPGNHVVDSVSFDGTVTHFAGNVTSTDPHGLIFTYDLYSPEGIVVDSSGTVDVASLKKLQNVSSTGAVSDASPTVNAALAAIGTPAIYDLTFDRTGNLYAADSGNHVVWKIGTDGTVTTVAGLADSAGAADGSGNNAQFVGPWALATNKDGNLVIADSATIRFLTPAGLVTTIAGSPNQTGSTDGVGAVARFNLPRGIACDAAGNLYIADTGNNTIRKGTPTAAVSAPIPLTKPNSEDQNVGAGSNVSFSVATAGTSVAFQWFKDGVTLTGATESTLNLPNVSATSEGTYGVTITNSAGATTIPIGTLRVYTPTLASFVSRHANPGGNFLWSIAASANQLIAVGDGGTILASTDGQAWSRRVSGTTDWLVGVTYAAGQFVVVGDHGDILISSDGVSWSKAASSGTTQRLNNVGFGNGLFVAVGEAGTILTSTDAQTWTPQQSGVTGWLRGLICSGLGYYHYAATGQGGAIIVSVDGISWRTLGPFSYFLASPPGTRNFTDDLEGAVVANSAMIAVGANGAAVSLLPLVMPAMVPGNVIVIPELHVDELGVAARLRGIAWGQNALFAMGENGTIVGAPNDTGPWATIPSGTTANLVAGTFFKDNLYVVGENETVLESSTLYNGRLLNISTRGLAGSGSNTMTAGFVVRGSASKQVLIRAAGPTLGAIGVAGTLAAPTLTLLDSAGKVIATNTGWGTAPNASAIFDATNRLGAFAFPSGSADCAMLITLPPSGYTAQVTAASGGPGVSLVEVYDADPISNTGPQTVNVSTRGMVGTGDNVMIAGFVIDGTSARRVLIRAVGPSLAQFGVSGILANPQLKLIDERGFVHLTSGPGDWSTGPDANAVRSAAYNTGAFSLQEGAQDAAVVTTLLPGLWTVQVSGVNNSTGAALVEVYELP